MVRSSGPYYDHLERTVEISVTLIPELPALLTAETEEDPSRDR
jgi:hypothetical protein